MGRYGRIAVSIINVPTIYMAISANREYQCLTVRQLDKKVEAFILKTFHYLIFIIINIYKMNIGTPNSLERFSTRI